MRKIKVGIIQQANVADMRTNLMNLAKSIEACAAHGAQLVVLQELHNSLYFCQTENTQLFDGIERRRVVDLSYGYRLGKQ